MSATLSAAVSQPLPTPDFAQARQQMVESQLRPNKVLDEAVLQLFEALPREQFLPPHLQPLAYYDEDIALGHGRALMEPMVQARLLQALAVRPNHKALEIATGCGLGAALLAGMGATTYALEADATLAQQAKQILGRQGFGQVQIMSGELANGWPAAAPYEAILVNGAISSLPTSWATQLAEGGRLAVVLRAGAHSPGKAMLYEKHHGQVTGREIFEANTPLLPGFEPPTQFEF